MEIQPLIEELSRLYDLCHEKLKTENPYHMILPNRNQQR